MAVVAGAGCPSEAKDAVIAGETEIATVDTNKRAQTDIGSQKADGNTNTHRENVGSPRNFSGLDGTIREADNLFEAGKRTLEKNGNETHATEKNLLESTRVRHMQL